MTNTETQETLKKHIERIFEEFSSYETIGGTTNELLEIIHALDEQNKERDKRIAKIEAFVRKQIDYWENEEVKALKEENYDYLSKTIGAHFALKDVLAQLSQPERQGN